MATATAPAAASTRRTTRIEEEAPPILEIIGSGKPGLESPDTPNRSAHLRPLLIGAHYSLETGIVDFSDGSSVEAPPK
jgi:hypothetical protein